MMLSRVALRGGLGVVAPGVGRAATFNGVRAFSSDLQGLAHTALFDFHQELGGKMVPFAGYALPVQYPSGVLKEHMHTRTEGCASLFDVSHMGQVFIRGKDAKAFVESVTVADVKGLKEGHATLSVIPNEQGGIIDDTIIASANDTDVFMVVNGACKHGDLEHFEQQRAVFGGDVVIEHRTDLQLLALQGPGAAGVLAKFAPEATQLSFMEGRPMMVNGVPCHVTRCGYTGEDGFEISVPEDSTRAMAEALLGDDAVIAAALGARDSLRLEAGLCLYGHDLDATTSPVEGTLLWTIAKRRREEANFVGAGPILDHIKNGVTRKRVGFTVGGAPAREGAKVFSADGETEIGVVTSGTRSPMLKKNIGMAYVAKGHFKVGTEVQIEVRNKRSTGVVTKMPFVPARYHK